MDRIQLRRDSSARWAEINPILLEGEVGYEIDTKLRKIGDGVNRWNDLEYLRAEGISQETGDSENVTMSQKAITRELTELGSEVRTIGSDVDDLIGASYTNSIFYDGNANNVYFDDILIKEGTKITFNVSGTARWDYAWIFYNDSVSGNRLRYIDQGNTYEVVAPTDITRIGIAVTSFVSQGTIELEISIKSRITSIENEIKLLESNVDNIDEQLKTVSELSNIAIIEGEVKDSFSQAGNTASVQLSANSIIDIKYSFSKAPGNWYIYLNKTGGRAFITVTDNKLDGEISKVLPYDVNSIILYTDAEEIGSVKMTISLHDSVKEIANAVPVYSNFINLSRPIEVGWKGKEYVVNIKAGSNLRIKYKFTNLTQTGWRLYANDYNYTLASSNSSVEGETIVNALSDIKKLILYTSAEEVGNAEFYMYELEKYDYNIDLAVGLPINTKFFSLVSSSKAESYAELDLKIGSKISLKVDGTAEWDRAWVYYNNDVSSKRLIDGVIKGKSYNIEITKEDIYQIGVCIFSIIAEGEVTLTILKDGSILQDKIELLENTIKELEDDISNDSTTIYSGKVGICMGDSHAVRREQWVKRVYDKIGATYNADLSSVVVGNGNSTGVGYEDCIDPMFAQAVRAVEQYNQGKKIDIVLLDNVHYGLSGTIESLIPFKPKDLINIGTFSANASQESSWFSSNFESIISGINPKLGTILKSVWEGLVYEINFSGTPNPNTTFIININGTEYSTMIEQGDTINTFVKRVGTWVFGEDQFVSTVENNILRLSYIGNETSPVVNISFNYGDSGVSATYTSSTETKYKYRYYRAWDLNSWNSINSWISPSTWWSSALKGAVELLLEKIPNVQIIMVAIPCYSLSKNDYRTEIGYNLEEFLNSGFYKNNRSRATPIIELASLYNLKAIDIEKLWGVSLINWFEFNPEKDVHPNQKGYDRIADTIIRELGK